MIAIRHTGLYVNDILQMENFYTRVFDMIPICSRERDQSNLFDELLDVKSVEIMTTKLVTPYGKQQGQGDMLELVKLITEISLPQIPENHSIAMIGMGHLAFGIDDIEMKIKCLLSEGGSQKTRITRMRNGNFCCFCKDPEGNWIELIQRVEGEYR